MPINEHPDFDKFVKLTNWMYDEHADASKLRLRFYSDLTHRVNAGCDISKGDRILWIPNSQILTFRIARTTELGKKMIREDIHKKYGMGYFLVAYIM